MNSQSKPPPHTPLPRIEYKYRMELQHYILTAIGAVPAGLLLPIMLVMLCASRTKDFQAMQWASVPRIVISLLLLGSPLTMIFADVVANIIRSSAQEQPLNRIMLHGAIVGMLIGFLNLPLMFSGCFLYTREWPLLTWLRILVLFLVSGGLSGTWVGWFTWRTLHPDERHIPRFSLKTLLIAAILWGALLLLFQPDPNVMGAAEFFD